MSFEDEFDSQLREIFISVLLFVFCFALSSIFLLKKRGIILQDDPILCYILSAISLGFALSSILIIPVVQSILSFPSTIDWLGINGKRFSNSFAFISMLGCNVSLLILNPYGYLFAESISPGNWNSIWSTALELVLLLFMLFTLGMLFFTRTTFNDMLGMPITVISKLASILVLTPGSFFYLRFGPNGLLKRFKNSFEYFVSSNQYDLGIDEPLRLKNEIMMMREWSRRNVNHVSEEDEQELKVELQTIEKMINSSSPFKQNCLGFINIMFFGVISFAVVMKLLTPRFLSYIFEGSLLMNLFIPSSFLLITMLDFKEFSPTIKEFLLSRSQIEIEGRRKTITTTTDSPSESFSLAHFTSIVLIFSSSTPIILSGIFELDLPKSVNSHPFFRNRIVIALYSFAVAIRCVYGFYNLFPHFKLKLKNLSG